MLQSFKAIFEVFIMFSLVLLAIFASKKPTKNGRDRFFMEKLRFSNGCKIHIFVYRRLGKVGMNQKLIFFEVMYKKSFIIFAFSDSWKIWPMPPCISGDSNFANPCYFQSLYQDKNIFCFLYQDKNIFYLCILQPFKNINFHQHSVTAIICRFFLGKKTQ